MATSNSTTSSTHPSTKPEHRAHEAKIGGGYGALVRPGHNSGTDTAPAFVTSTSVFDPGEDNQDGPQLVAARVLCNAPGGDLWYDRATVYASEDQARDGWKADDPADQRVYVLPSS